MDELPDLTLGLQHFHDRLLGPIIAQQVQAMDAMQRGDREAAEAALADMRRQAGVQFLGWALAKLEDEGHADEAHAIMARLETIQDLNSAEGQALLDEMRQRFVSQKILRHFEA